MNGRDRVPAFVHHREADRVPLDFGGTLVTGIQHIACSRLQDYLDLPPRGRFIFATIHSVQSDVPPENLMAMRETLMEFGS